MRHPSRLLITIAAACISLVLPRLFAEEHGIECLKSAHFMAPMDSPGHRKYAPDRDVDILHIAIDVTPDFLQRSLEGKTTLRFKTLAKPVRELRLDAVDLKVASVTSTEKIQAHQVTGDSIIITFTKPIPAGKEASLTITYHAEPALGIYFRTPEMGYKVRDTHLFSQGEEIEARHWYPCFDAPNDKFTSEVTCRVPGAMTVISNGRLVSEKVDAASGLKVVHWSQEKPHVNYLITLVAGYFKKLEDRYRDIPMAFYTLPSETAPAINSFKDTKDMMAFFEKEIGVPYPWPKYDQVCVNDFVAGGMENTSATTLTDNTLFTTETENIRSSEGLVSHELAHQWFGDLVTCKDWSHIWLNEGFATYYQTLYAAHKNGPDEMLYQLYQRNRTITGMPNDTNSIVRRTYDNPREMFGYLAYPKGGWVLHMLRSELGPDLYRKCIKTYLERHQYDSVVTEDLRKVIEELSGKPFDQFFEQWLYHAHHPELEVTYSWDEKTKLAKVTIRQTQKVDDNVLLFNIPMTIRFKGGFGTVDQTFRIRQKEEDFYFSLKSAPKIVRLDPEYAILEKVSFNLPDAMVYAQLADKTDSIGRLLAIEQLANKKSKEAVAKLKDVLNNDAFYGVRIEASKALRAIHSDEALDALIASAKQSDARVRQQVVADLGGFYSDIVFDASLEVLKTELNPDIISTALRNFGLCSKPDVHHLLLSYLQSKSYRNVLAVAAVEAMKLQDDPVYIPALLQTLPAYPSEFQSRSLGQSLGTLAYLARNETKKDDVRELLLKYTQHRMRNLQLAAITALGTLGDPKAIAVLETFVAMPRESRERTAAEQSIAKLRGDRKPSDDLKTLRQEVTDLQKSNRDLLKEVEGLKKKAEAKDTAPVAK